MTRILLTAGPTHEPIDSVRYVGNRSSGRMGLAIAHAAAQVGWDTHLMMGPIGGFELRSVPHLRVSRFRTAEDLRRLLGAHAGECDVLIMAAAVADFRPKVDPAMFNGKFRRKDQSLTLQLEPTPDLIAEVSEARRVSGRTGQLLVGFALEPEAEMLESARSKLTRKGLDFVVANPLETMDSPDFRGAIVQRDPSATVFFDQPLPKDLFAARLIDFLKTQLEILQSAAKSGR